METYHELIGQTVADRYEVRSLLGVGGIGAVYLAIQQPLGREVALKVLHSHLYSRPGTAARFLREARAASLLNHPGSVSIYDYGEWGDRHYIAMEFVAGRTLTSVIETEFPLETRRIAEYIVQLCDVLDVAHEMPLVHRDLKPENVLILRHEDGRERVKVVDFGLALLLRSDETRLTTDGSVSGTPVYMSPEQARNDELDPRSDIYAIGCILYELLCGAPPFDAKSPIEVFAMHLYDEPIPPSKRSRRPISQALESAALWCLEKQPDRRPETVRQLRLDILEAIDASKEEALETRLAQRILSRDMRADALGSPITKRRQLSQRPLDITVLLHQPVELPFDISAVPVLGARDVVCFRDWDLAELPEIAYDGTIQAIVVDARGHETEVLDTVSTWRRPNVPVIIIGPDDNFDAMQRALGLGVADYLPASLLSTLPKRIIRAIRRLTVVVQPT